MSQHATTQHNQADDHTPHPVPLGTLIGVFVLLMLLTFLTVAVTWGDFGPGNLFLALLIAVVKASLVGLYFMHLRYDGGYNALVFVASLLFVVLFIGFALLDSSEYQPDYTTPAIIEQTAQPAAG